MEVIEVGVSDENKVDGRKMVVKKTCVTARQSPVIMSPAATQSGTF